MRVTMNPQGHGRAHQMIQITCEGGIQARALILRMDTQPVRQMVGHDHRRAYVRLGEPVYDSDELGEMTPAGVPVKVPVPGATVAWAGIKCHFLLSRFTAKMRILSLAEPPASRAAWLEHDRPGRNADRA